jgi:hypothetical protein
MSQLPEGFELRSELRDGYVFFWQKGAVRDLDELERVQSQMGEALDASGTRVAMFDNRQTRSPDAMLRAAMWTWLSENVDRAAMIQAVAKNVRRADRTAERNRLSFRAFEDEAEAEAWLRRR